MNQTATHPYHFTPPRLPRTNLRIGVIGAGGIVQNAHLPAYQKAGFRVSAIADVQAGLAAQVAARFGVPRGLEDAFELIRATDVDVIDLAVPEAGRTGLIEEVARVRKPLLLQKPLAYSLERARWIVELFHERNVPLAVNQNARWAPEFLAVRQLLERGLLGRVFDVRWTMRNTCDRRAWTRDSWYSKDSRFQVLSWSVHHLDLFRYWLDDEAETVYCALPRRPDQRFAGDVIASAILWFRSGAHASMVDSNAATPGRPEVQEVDVDGTAGSAYACVSKPRALRYWLHSECPKEGEDAPVHEPALNGEWYPDGFAGSMGEFLGAVESGIEPSISGRRNLGTLQIVEACYRSAATRRAIQVASLEPV